MEEKVICKDHGEPFTARMVTKEDEYHQAESTTDNKPVATTRRQTALDVANMIAPSRSIKDGPRSEFSVGTKPLDLSHRGLPAPSSAAAAAAYKTFYPYPSLPISSTLSPYSFLGEGSSALTPANYAAGYSAAATYPLYGSYPVAADSTAPSLSTLRLSALLASRKRRAAVSTSDKGDSSIPPQEPSRKKVRPVPDEKKDSAYWDRRRKNNDAAKRSRDARREKEEEIALRAVFLEQENMKLRAEVSILKSEMGRLHYMVYNC
ncbi:cell death specification protein 2-like [Acanthaster planci]|uniref:Cell death specification protein 2-like n=1 Tax=Acanthaster planci TaxID=133434 RepID=A0A8B7YWV4_ACAPL|nr:cell death specification protein 2-like [Acanthaster planci]